MEQEPKILYSQPIAFPTCILWEELVLYPEQRVSTCPRSGGSANMCASLLLTSQKGSSTN